MRTDEPTHLRLGINELGRIKTGGSTPAKNGGKIPHKLDHFVAAGKYQAAFERAYPEKPSTIHILFPDDDEAQVCCQEIEFRCGNALVGRSNGFEYEIWSKKQGKLVDFEAHPSDADALANLDIWKAQWPGLVQKETLTMRFILINVQNILGYWQFQTAGSLSSIPNLVSAFDTAKGLCGGRKELFTRIPFDLNLAQHKSQKPGSNSVYNVLTMAANATEDSINRAGNWLDSGKKLQHLLTDESANRLIGGPTETADFEVVETT